MLSPEAPPVSGPRFCSDDAAGLSLSSLLSFHHHLWKKKDQKDQFHFELIRCKQRFYFVIFNVPWWTFNRSKTYYLNVSVYHPDQYGDESDYLPSKIITRNILSYKKKIFVTFRGTRGLVSLQERMVFHSSWEEEEHTFQRCLAQHWWYCLDIFLFKINKNKKEFQN